MLALEPGLAGEFLHKLGPAIDHLWGRPRAVVILSPHTATRTPFVLGAARHETIHDFGGFPAPLYEIRYDAAGEPVLSKEVARLIQTHDIRTQWVAQGGLDHGIWTLLMHIYPKVDVPVVPVSLVPSLQPADMLALGQSLHALRTQGILVVGSGSLTHNLRRFFSQPRPVDAPEDADCASFRSWVLQRTQQDDWPALLAYRTQAPHAREMHPTDEHWLPFYFAAGAASVEAGKPPAAIRVHASVTHGHLAMDAYAFGESDQLAKLANVLSS
jgi:4,5-DOPA dioxygenase extradiol